MNEKEAISELIEIFENLNEILPFLWEQGYEINAIFTKSYFALDIRDADDIQVCVLRIDG